MINQSDELWRKRDGKTIGTDRRAAYGIGVAAVATGEDREASGVPGRLAVSLIVSPSGFELRIIRDSLGGI